MPNALDKKESLFQNLKAAGCDKKLTAECIDSCDKGTLYRKLPELTSFRKALLKETRKKKKQIDCLDFLLNKIKSGEY